LLSTADRYGRRSPAGRVTAPRAAQEALFDVAETAREAGLPTNSSTRTETCGPAWERAGRRRRPSGGRGPGLGPCCARWCTDLLDHDGITYTGADSHRDAPDDGVPSSSGPGAGAVDAGHPAAGGPPRTRLGGAGGRAGAAVAACSMRCSPDLYGPPQPAHRGHPAAGTALRPSRLRCVPPTGIEVPGITSFSCTAATCPGCRTAAFRSTPTWTQAPLGGGGLRAGPTGALVAPRDSRPLRADRAADPRRRFAPKRLAPGA